MAGSEAEYEARSREAATQTKFGWMSTFVVRADRGAGSSQVFAWHSPIVISKAQQRLKLRGYRALFPYRIGQAI